MTAGSRHQTPVTDDTRPEGRTNDEVAGELHITTSTAKTHVASLMRKLSARNRVEVGMWAYESGRT